MINKETWKNTLGTTLFAVLILAGCGGGTTKGGNGGEGSNIPYLKDNHANYSEHGSSLTPAPTKDENAKSIDWTIAASSEEGATKLADHINFMTAKLEGGKNPRAWDKLFLMEAYMKVNGYYTTSVERSGTNVVISKKADTSCAYEVISAHSDAVSGDFFAKGDIEIDNSPKAEEILASSACTAEKSVIEAYILANQKSKG